GAQAGLSWSTILKKREHYRAVFDGFDPQRIAAYDEARVLPCSPAELPCTASAWSGCAVEFGLPINSRNGSA
nr:DNA-3-methyladenine glycosylase I [Propionivibrio sp.]